MCERALERTAALWPDLEVASEWVREAVEILNNADEADGPTVKTHYQDWIKRLTDRVPGSVWLG